MFDIVPLNDTSQVELQTQLFMRSAHCAHIASKKKKFLLNYIINITVDIMNDSK